MQHVWGAYKMRRFEILVTVFVCAIALIFALMPIDWCAVAHRRELGALICFLVFIMYLIVIDAGKKRHKTMHGALIGALYGLSIASIFASGPIGFLVGGSIGVGLGKFGIDWAA